MRERLKTALVCLCLATAVFILYAQVLDHPFIWLDDKHYIVSNTHVNGGFSLENVAWAFRFSQTGEKTYWHPLVWFSHMLDCQLFGLNAGLHHLSNVLYHAVNAVLLFLALRLMTGSLWRSAFAAALFALHPVNVDTVAWLAERKNLLSTAFWLLTVIAYWFYTRRIRAWRYCLVVFFFLLGLLSKPMLITLPCTLLLLDYWPLKRIRFDEGRTVLQTLKSRDFLTLVLEKVPLFAFSFAFGFLTIHSLAVTDQFVTQPVPMGLRIENAIVSYAVYLHKLFWPAGLTIFHPFPILIPAWKIATSLALLLAVTAAAVFSFRRHPYLITGWLWFLGTFVTVIGVVQGGLWPAYAERWAYVPYIGLFFALSWLAGGFLKHTGHRAVIAGVMAFLILGCLSSVSWRQLGFWKDDYTLFSRSLSLDPFNYLSHSALASHYIVRKDYSSALSHFEQALAISPGNPYIMYEQANLLVKIGRKDEAIRILREALRSKPNHFDARLNLANLLFIRGKLDEAMVHYKVLIHMNPGDPRAYYNLGNAHLRKSDLTEAEGYFRKSLQIRPDWVEALYGLALVYTARQEYAQAVETLQAIRGIQPSNPESYYNLACIYARWNKPNEAVSWLKQATDRGFGNVDLILKDPDLAGIRNTDFVKGLITQGTTSGNEEGTVRNMLRGPGQ